MNKIQILNWKITSFLMQPYHTHTYTHRLYTAFGSFISLKRLTVFTIVQLLLYLFDVFFFKKFYFIFFFSFEYDVFKHHFTVYDATVSPISVTPCVCMCVHTTFQRRIECHCFEYSAVEICGSTIHKEHSFQHCSLYAIAMLLIWNAIHI